LLGVALAVVEDDGALPAAFLVTIKLAEVGDDVLPGSDVGAPALDEREVSVGLAVLGARVASQKHRRLLGSSMAKGTVKLQEARSSLHGPEPPSTTEKPRNSCGAATKIADFSPELRNLG